MAGRSIVVFKSVLRASLIGGEGSIFREVSNLLTFLSRDYFILLTDHQILRNFI